MIALLVGAACGGGVGGGAESGTGTSTGTVGGTAGGTATAGGITEATGTAGEGLVECSEIQCLDGALGCACDDGGCARGDCVQGRCVLEVDGMVQVPAGPFCMGCDPATDASCISDELPAHEVFVSAFEIDRLEVTQGQWQDCIDAGACPVPDDTLTCVNKWDPVMLTDHPVVCVDFDASRGYCEWVGKRLPTEAEWEKAARGVDRRLFPWGDTPPTCDLANHEHVDGECVDATVPVGSYPGGMSPYGAMDMGGNVWERLFDWYGPDVYARSAYEDPKGAVTGTARVLRGGSFTSVQKFLRTTARDGARAPWKTARNVGLRCARSVE